MFPDLAAAFAQHHANRIADVRIQRTHEIE
jgi:hypothetical protein